MLAGNTARRNMGPGSEATSERTSCLLGLYLSDAQAISRRTGVNASSSPETKEDVLCSRGAGKNEYSGPNPRKTVLLIDPIDSGHHVFYATRLAQGLVELGWRVFVAGAGSLPNMAASAADLEGTFNVDHPGHRGSVFGDELAKSGFVRRSLDLAISLDVSTLHFLYLDRYVVALYLSLLFSRLHVPRIRSTLHWAYMLPQFGLGPVRRVKNSIETRALAGIEARQGDFRLMVHSEPLRAALTQHAHLLEVDVVPYPVQPTEPYSEPLDATAEPNGPKLIRTRLGIPNDATLLLAFGGTRFDKGADFAVRALQHLPGTVHLLIAGKPSNFKAEDLLKIARQHNVANRIHLDLRYIPDAEVADYFRASNVVVLPYRRCFAGESGPLTIAASLGIPVVASDVGFLRHSIDTYRLGTWCAPETPELLAEGVGKVLESAPGSGSLAFVLDHHPIKFARAVAKSYES